MGGCLSDLSEKAAAGATKGAINELKKQVADLQKTATEYKYRYEAIANKRENIVF